MQANTDVEIAKVVERIHALETWQEKQNGQLERIATKVDGLSYHLSDEVASIRADMGQRFDGMKTWLVGLLGSALLAVGLLATNLIIGKP